MFSKQEMDERQFQGKCVFCMNVYTGLYCAVCCALRWTGLCCAVLDWTGLCCTVMHVRAYTCMRDVAMYLRQLFHCVVDVNFLSMRICIDSSCHLLSHSQFGLPFLDRIVPRTLAVRARKECCVP